MTEPTDVRELRERLDKMIESSEGSVVMNRGCNPYYANYANRMERDLATLREAAAALERLEKLEALRSRLQMFLAAVGASTPDDHPWVVEARALANALRPCELSTPAPAPQSSTPFELPELLPISGDELSQAILRSRARAPAPQGKPEYETALDTLLGPQPENFAELLARRSILQHQLTLVEQALDRIAPAPAPQQGGEP